MEDSVPKYDLFQKAYKKLKSTAYYDKTNLHLRDRIAEAENTLNITIEERLKDLHQAFVASDSTKWEKKKEDILESISCRLLPKKIMDTKEEKNCSDRTKGVLISGVPAKQVKVDEIQYFIDMKIEGMILGVLWIMMIGWQLDKSYTNCYGNRIRKTLYNEFSKEPTFSPALFEPYFQNYESWRDQALTLAQKCMQQDDVLIFTLDFKRYYYSVDVSEKFMKEILTRVKGKSDYNEEYLSRINDFVYCVIKRYSQIYREHRGEERIRRILPIGFLPSGVLANECLKKFDTAILDGWNPLYYGRYVDDILLVEKVEKGSRIAQKAQDGKLEFYEAFEYYTVNNSRWTGKENRNARAVFKKEEDECGTYCILPEFTKPLGSATKIQLQASKIKLFYFQRGQSDSPLPFEGRTNNRFIEENIKTGELNKQPVFQIGKPSFSKIRVAVANIQMDISNFDQAVMRKPNRSYRRYQQIAELVNTAVREKADMLVMPEACTPKEWLPTLARTCEKNHLAVVTGVEHIIEDNCVYNLTAVILPYEEKWTGQWHSVILYHSKNHFAPEEKRMIESLYLRAMEGIESSEAECDAKYELYSWNGFWFTVYCCFELTSIRDRSIFQSYIDALIAVEWNQDVNYYSNIIESLSRDIHCYCIQTNTSKYGDSRITKPSKTENKDILRIKGGSNATAHIGTIDLEQLREFQMKAYSGQKEDKTFKPTPPDFDYKGAYERRKGTMFECFCAKKKAD